MKAVQNIEIPLDNIKEGLKLFIEAQRENTIFDAEGSELEHNEERFQLIEGFIYDYEISDSSFELGNIGDNIIIPHKRKPYLGTISTNIFVGTLSIPILEKITQNECGIIKLEVQSLKTGYRDDYREMLKYISEKCTDLLLQVSSPVSQSFDIDFFQPANTLYQRFNFIRSVLGAEEFAEAIHRIVLSPSTKWTEEIEERDICKSKRFSNNLLKQLIKGNNRVELNERHYLRHLGLKSLPRKISSVRKTDSVDTPENRFIKHAVETFLIFCSKINSKSKEYNYSRLEMESEDLILKLENMLHHSIFNDISRPSTLKLNSPILQRKEGYREILRVWLMFDLASKLIWSGGDDIYSGGKKDIANLYEYWLFFQLLDLFQSIFAIEPKDISELICSTTDGLSLQIKQGINTAISGTYIVGNKLLQVKFNYNRSFSGRKNYPEAGSWTTTLRPDYTFSMWPVGISESEAEEQELIVHIHFDAKYKISNLTELINNDIENELCKEKVEHRKGIFKNADLLKMHAYKDAIRRTAGAYVLYPGGFSVKQKGFHEIIPGLGAFAVYPSKDTHSGISELRTFIMEVVEHYINRTSQRAKIAFRTFEIFKNPPEIDNTFKERIPESINSNRDLIPDEVFVLVGYYKSHDQFNWIKRNNLYNFRVGSDRGSLVLDKETVSSKYLLLHTKGDEASGNLWKIVSNGPKVFSKEDLIMRGYPSPNHEFYLVFRIEPVKEEEFLNLEWSFKQLKNYSPGRDSAYPFTASLAELMMNKKI